MLPWGRGGRKVPAPRRSSQRSIPAGKQGARGDRLEGNELTPGRRGGRARGRGGRRVPAPRRSSQRPIRAGNEATVAIRIEDIDLTRDRELVEAWRAGDPSAFDDLYRRYFDRLRAFCQRRVGDRADAEEL